MSPIWRVAFFCAVFCVPGAAQGQLTFEWGSIRKDTLYQTIEDCLGLMTKVEGQTLDGMDTALDPKTLPSRLKMVPNTVSPIAVQMARQCSQKFSVAQLLAKDSSNVQAMLNAFKLLFKAQRDTEALTFLDGWLAKLPASQDTLKTVIRMQVSGIVLEHYPTRFTVLRKLADDTEFPRFWDAKISVYGQIMLRARELRDTAEYEQAVAWLISTPKMLSDVQMETDTWLRGSSDWITTLPLSFYVRQATEYANRETILTKLRENVDSFLIHMASLDKGMGIGDGSVKRETAKPIIAEYWFPEKPATPRPTVPGKVGIVWPLKDVLCNPCYYEKGWLGRLLKKFPEIEVTALMRTHGHHGKYFGTLPPEQEARLMDSIHRTMWGFPGTIAVHQTQFWRVDETYDRRQVEEPGPNEDQYCLMGPFCGIPKFIDWQGKFIVAPNLAMDQDESTELFFEALMRHKPK